MGWYALQCKSGQEKKLVHLCKQHISSVALEDAFFFYSERLWRIKGKWDLIEKNLFPGYIFLESSEPCLLLKELEQYQKFIKFLGEEKLISIYDEEKQILKELCGTQHCLKLSYGYKQHGMNYITAGPLKGKEKSVTKFDWHSRLAVIDISIGMKRSIIWAGLEIDKEVLPAGGIVTGCSA